MTTTMSWVCSLSIGNYMLLHENPEVHMPCEHRESIRRPGKLDTWSATACNSVTRWQCITLGRQSVIYTYIVIHIREDLHIIYIREGTYKNDKGREDCVGWRKERGCVVVGRLLSRRRSAGARRSWPKDLHPLFPALQNNKASIHRGS